MHFLSEHNIYIFLVQVLILLASARGLGELFRRWKLPSLTAELLVGLLFGPAIFGLVAPSLYQSIFPADPLQHDMLETVAWIGVLFLLLQTGLDIDFISAWSYRNEAVIIAVSDVVVPMAMGFTMAYLLPDHYLVDPGKRILFALFIAIVMAISAVPVSARVLHDLRLSKTDLGFLIMSTLSVNDVIGWLIFAISISLYIGTDAASMAHLFGVMAMTILFAIFCLTIGRSVTSQLLVKIRKNNFPEPGTSLTFICVLGLLCGAITMKIGIHAMFGFFLAGIMAGQSSAVSERTRQILGQMVHAVFVPLFFASIGLKINFVSGFDVLLVTLFCIFGIVGRFLGAWFGVKFTNIPVANRTSIAIAHIPGGSMEIVVAILALQLKIISEPIFVAIVISAVVSSIAIGPWLSYSLSTRKRISVLEFFNRSAIVANIKRAERDAAIAQLCDIAAEQENMTDESPILAAVLQRENAAGTGMEEGIAVPHARLPFIKKPAVIFGRSLSGIDWNSPDGKPTHFVFLILTPKQDLEAQVQILGSIAHAMSNDQVRQRMLAAADSQGLWHALHEALAPLEIKRGKK